MQVLLGYFESVDIEKIPDLNVSPGIIELTRTHSGFKRTDVPVDVGKISMLGSLHVVGFVGSLKEATQRRKKGGHMKGRSESFMAAAEAATCDERLP